MYLSGVDFGTRSHHLRFVDATNGGEANPIIFVFPEPDQQTCCHTTQQQALHFTFQQEVTTA